MGDTDQIEMFSRKSFVGELGTEVRSFYRIELVVVLIKEVRVLIDFFDGRQDVAMHLSRISLFGFLHFESEFQRDFFRDGVFVGDVFFPGWRRSVIHGDVGRFGYSCHRHGERRFGCCYVASYVGRVPWV